MKQIEAMHEDELHDLWPRIQAQPGAYIMAKEKLRLCNYARHFHIENNVAQTAVIKFWHQDQAALLTRDGAKSSENYYI